MKTTISLMITLAVVQTATTFAQDEGVNFISTGGWNTAVSNEEDVKARVEDAIGDPATVWADDVAQYTNSLCLTKVKDIEQQVVAGMKYRAIAEGCEAEPDRSGYCKEECEEVKDFKVVTMEHLSDANGDVEVDILEVEFN